MRGGRNGRRKRTRGKRVWGGEGVATKGGKKKERQRGREGNVDRSEGSKKSRKRVGEVRTQKRMVKVGKAT